MPRDLSDSQTVSTVGQGLYQMLIHRLPERMRDDFTQEQLAALRDAARHCEWGTHPVDLRWRLPGLFKRYYLVVLAGPELRGAQRRTEESRHRSPTSLASVLFLLCLTTGGTILGGLIFTLLVVWFRSM